MNAVQKIARQDDRLERPAIVRASTDHRWQHHRYLAELLLNPGEERDYLYRITGPSEARVRYRDEILNIPPSDTRINWRINFVPKLRGRYGDGRPYQREYSQDLVARQLGGALYPAIIITGIEIALGHVRIERENRRSFNLAEARVWGNGLVHDREGLDYLLRQGIGEGKTYGCGMLEIELADTALTDNDHI